MAYKIQETNSVDHLPIPTWKRALDIFCILFVMPVLLPLMVLIALAIKILSTGPVLFKQERIGYLGRRFTCLKFRTMVVNADSAVHQGYFTQLMTSNVPMMKMDVKGDPRLIRCGALLRSSGLDELPQVFNVLWGEMSLVGPRPCLPYEHEKYLPRYKKRYQTLPGLTGFWQVNGKNKTTFRKMIAMDIWYAKNKSVMLDIWIILKTIPTVIALVMESHPKPSAPADRLLSLGKAPRSFVDRRRRSVLDHSQAAA